MVMVMFWVCYSAMVDYQWASFNDKSYREPSEALSTQSFLVSTIVTGPFLSYLLIIMLVGLFNFPYKILIWMFKTWCLKTIYFFALTAFLTIFYPQDGSTRRWCPGSTWRPRALPWSGSRGGRPRARRWAGWWWGISWGRLNGTSQGLLKLLLTWIFSDWAGTDPWAEPGLGANKLRKCKHNSQQQLQT